MQSVKLIMPLGEVLSQTPKSLSLLLFQAVSIQMTPLISLHPENLLEMQEFKGGGVLVQFGWGGQRFECKQI